MKCDVGLESDKVLTSDYTVLVAISSPDCCADWRLGRGEIVPHKT